MRGRARANADAARQQTRHRRGGGRGRLRPGGAAASLARRRIWRLTAVRCLGEPRTVGLVTDASLDDTIVAWALAAAGGDHLICVTGLCQGGPPWLMRYEASGWAGSAVVRVGAPETAGTQKFEVRGMALARAGGVPAPAVIAARADDTAALLLTEYVDGSSCQPAVPDPARLEALGRARSRGRRPRLGAMRRGHVLRAQGRRSRAGRLAARGGTPR